VDSGSRDAAAERGGRQKIRPVIRGGKRVIRAGKEKFPECYAILQTGKENKARK